MVTLLGTEAGVSRTIVVTVMKFVGPEAAAIGQPSNEV